jgi:hemerythrin superfamily protein
MPDAHDAIEVLTNDHRTVEQLFAAYEQATDPEEQTRIVHEVVHELAVHGEIEELLFYPRIRQVLDDGDRAADEAIHEHVEIKETLNELDRMSAGEEGFDERMRELIAEVRHHVSEEESQVFPQFRAGVPVEDLQELGARLEQAKAIVPTRPHPNAPTGPLGKLAAAPGAALVDRVRDAIRSATE